MTVITDDLEINFIEIQATIVEIILYTNFIQKTPECDPLTSIVIGLTSILAMVSNA
jgi:hypothetical protein